jgi:hypothetical protein
LVGNLALIEVVFGRDLDQESEQNQEGASRDVVLKFGLFRETVGLNSVSGGDEDLMAEVEALSCERMVLVFGEKEVHLEFGILLECGVVLALGANDPRKWSDFLFVLSKQVVVLAVLKGFDSSMV